MVPHRSRKPGQADSSPGSAPSSDRTRSPRWIPGTGPSTCAPTPRGRALIIPARALKAGAAITAAAAILFVPASAPALTATANTSVTAPSSASIASAERVLREQLQASGIPGGAVVVVSGGRVEARGVGDAGGGRRVTAQTPFVLGSASKSFTALALLKLVDSGKVALDDPVRTYVPEFRLAAGQPVDDITVRHLLQQTSGLDDLSGGPLLASATDGTSAEAIAELRNAKLASKPGETWLYANANYVLAGLVVEHVSGLPYGEFIQHRIFEPLGMRHSYIAATAARTAGLSKGHRFWFGLPVITGPTTREATRAAGYLMSTAQDLGRYLAMYLADGVTANGDRLVSAQAVRTLTRAGPRAHLGPWAQGQASRYAMGWFRGGPWGEAVAFHPGNTPDTSTMLSMFPRRGVAVATVLNAGNELPVPGNPFIADRVARNVIHAALNQPVSDLPSLRRFYLFFDLVVVALLGAAAWGLVRAVRTARHPYNVRHRLRGWSGVLVRGVTVVGLVVLPTLSYGWRGAWTWAPDVTLVVAALAALLAATTALRLAALTRRGPHVRAPEALDTPIGGHHVHP